MRKIPNIGTGTAIKHAKVHMGSETVYTLAEGVQVREEIFGLLFYDYRGPKLYFAPTRDMIGSDFFDGRQSMQQLIESIITEHHWPRSQIEKQLDRVFKMLRQKGLINEQ